jgi:exopolyphosphatase/guanosine-5'-triphosphate,3'-diphosphate pyrophosphatase
VEDTTLRLGFPRGWLAAHALTAADLEQEAEYLRSVGYRLKFK